MSRRQMTYAALGVGAVVGTVVVYRAAKGTCGCEGRKSWLRKRGLWPQEVV